jgi:hypothetical protein
MVRRCIGPAVELSGEWASDANQLLKLGFPDAPHRTRRAPFDTHRALPRCSRVTGARFAAREVGPDAHSGLKGRGHPAVPPPQRPASRPMPAILRRQDPHRGIGMLLVEPSQDGPPDMMVGASEDALRWAISGEGTSRFPELGPTGGGMSAEP